MVTEQDNFPAIEIELEKGILVSKSVRTKHKRTFIAQFFWTLWKIQIFRYKSTRC